LLYKIEEEYFEPSASTLAPLLSFVGPAAEKSTFQLTENLETFFRSRRDLQLDKFPWKPKDEVRQTKNSKVTNSVQAKATRPFITGRGKI